MSISVQSSIAFGDVQGLQDFFFVHRLTHLAIDGAIAAQGGGAMPNSTLDSQSALDGWVAAFAGNTDTSEALTDWLQLHANLHQAEYSALNFGVAPDLGVVDFTDPQQFNDWMFAHNEIHDTLAAATGTN